ncbi:hypothetical protein DPMN_021510 [Dreissena polymorpha]|uniref:Uncharacterized protein n=1 Tax=Dreissena polymorpha TaxID=45954 RepID=A0A9D4NIP0_DREPO|nr:hypothetical protein DPMN_021510 [Dreissena polymorpha]
MRASYHLQHSDLVAKVDNAPLSWVPTADQINSIKPDQAVGYWSGSVGMSGQGRPGRSALVGLPIRYFFTCQKISSSGRVGNGSRSAREVVVYQSSRRSS